MEEKESTNQIKRSGLEREVKSLMTPWKPMGKSLRWRRVLNTVERSDQIMSEKCPPDFAIRGLL